MNRMQLLNMLLEEIRDENFFRRTLKNEMNLEDIWISAFVSDKFEDTSEMFSFLADQEVLNGVNERVEYFVEERVTKIPNNFQVNIWKESDRKALFCFVFFVNREKRIESSTK